MRRTFISTRPSSAVYRAFGGQQARRTFATPPIKSDTPPSPIEPSKEQAHPIGPFYEAVLRTPGPLPPKKPEQPPVTSKTSPAQPPKPTPEHQQPKPAQEKPAAPAAEEKGKAAPEPAAEAEDKKPARRPRKTKQSGKDETSASSKAKSVPSSSSSPNTSSLPPLPPSDQNQNQPSPPPPAEPQPNPLQTHPQPHSRVLFSASLAGPTERAERLARLRTESRLVAGVVVPPKPEEPDNCCMSGCVNCVWERYRDDMEEWAARTGEAERRLAAQAVGEGVGVTEESMEGVERGRSGMELGVWGDGIGGMEGDEGGMEGDGGGSSSRGEWEIRAAAPSSSSAGIVKDFWDEELYKNVPVGIREFMKHEKRLKEKHRREGTAGG